MRTRIRICCIAAIDDNYADEWQAATEMRMACSLFSFEDFEEGVFRPRPAFVVGETIIYRGWMLRPERYAAQGATLVTDTAQYRHCHYLPECYPACIGDTPEAVFATRDADFAWRGRAHGRHGKVPALVASIAERIDSPFFP